MGMAAGDITALQRIGEEVTAQATNNTNVYLGTNKGKIYIYVIGNGANQAMSVLADLQAKIESMCYYSNLLYVGLAGGDFKKVATA
jgi:hypothetical protein